MFATYNNLQKSFEIMREQFILIINPTLGKASNADHATIALGNAKANSRDTVTDVKFSTPRWRTPDIFLSKTLYRVKPHTI